MHAKRTIYLLIMACLFAAGSAYAQTNGTADDSDAAPVTEEARPATPAVRELQPVEIRALRASDNAPFSKTNISGAQLQSGNLGQDLPYLLQYTPSVVVTSDAGAGVGYTGIRIRGTDATRINLTLNGVPVNDAEDQGSYFVDVPDLASSVSSVQIQRGVGTSTNGAGAFGATVSISNLDEHKTTYAEGDFSYGSFNTQKYTVRAGTGLINNRFSLDVRLSQISSDGYIERSASNLKAFQLNGGWKLDSKTRLRFMILQGKEITHQAWDGVPEDSLATHRRYNELGLKSDGTFYDNQTDNYTQNYYQLFADHSFNKIFSAHVGLYLTRGYGYYEEYHNSASLADYGLPPFVTPAGDTLSTPDLIRQLWLDNYYYGGIFSLLYEKKSTKLTFGGGWSQYEGGHYGYVTWAQYGVPDHYKYYNLNAQKNDLNFYAKAEQNIGDNTIAYLDLQYRNIAYYMNGFEDDLTARPAVNYNFFNPKAGITYLLRNTGATQEKLYASFAVANHEPNRDDFDAAAVDSALPKPERLYDAEGGYEYRSAKVTAGVNLYFMQYKDQLVLTGALNDVGASIRTNVPSSYRAGIELQAAWKPVDVLTLQGNVTFSRNKINNFIGYVYNYDSGRQQIIAQGNTDLAFSPDVVAGGSALVQPFLHGRAGKGFSIQILGKYVGRQYLDNTQTDTRKIIPYGLCNVQLKYVIAKLSALRELGLTLALNNIFDHYYVSNGATYPDIEGGKVVNYNYYYPQAGFNVLAGISVRW